MKDMYTLIAYGDSLTQGHLGFETLGEPAPYAEFLEYHIYRYLKTQGFPFTVSVSTMSGYGGMVTAAPRLGFHNLPLEKVLEKQPDACIVLGGTNDLGYMGTGRYEQIDDAIIGKVEALAQNLFGIYSSLKAHAIEPIAVTVPPMRVHPLVLKEEGEKMYWQIQRFGNDLRHLLNLMIFTHARNEHIGVVDLVTPMQDSKNQMSHEYSAGDWLHFNKYGYFVMAEEIFKQGARPLLDEWMKQQ